MGRTRHNKEQQKFSNHCEIEQKTIIYTFNVRVKMKLKFLRKLFVGK